MKQPAWGLYQDDELVASVRAEFGSIAKGIFIMNGYEGQVKRLS